jgi:type II secretion system protein I
MTRAMAGFTLLETLVALAILGVVMATVFGVIGSGLRSAHRDEDRLLLGFVAQNLLVRSRLDLNPIAGPRSGDIGGGLRWRIESEPYLLPEDILPEMPTAAAESPARFPNDGKAGAGEAATASAGYFARDPKTEAGDRPAFGSTPAATDRESTTSETGRDGTKGEGDQPTAARPREPLRLRLVKVIVEKGDQRFELSGLAAEPRRERAATR